MFVLACLGWVVLCAAALGRSFVSEAAAADLTTATTYTTLLGQARGVLPNAYGPVKAKVSTNLALTVQFSIVAGTGYAAGPVLATTNANGQVVRIAKGRQACAIAYAKGGAISSVRCTTSRRQLEHVPDSEAENQGEEEMNSQGAGHRVSRRLYSEDCAACLNSASSTFSTKIRAACSATLYGKVTAPYRWVRNAGATLCAMTSKLGKPGALAKRTCRCCVLNSDCASGVCSAGVCLAQKIGNGSNCPDGEDEDCESGACAVSPYRRDQSDIRPRDYICCPNGTKKDDPYVISYCTGSQEAGTFCSVYDEFCKSGVCAYPDGICLAQKEENGKECGDDAACQSGICRSNCTCPDSTPNCGCSNYCLCYTPDCNCANLCDEWNPGNGEPCVGDRDCPNNLCGIDSYPSGVHVCCPSNQIVELNEWNFPFHSPDRYCTATLELGEQCRDDTSAVCKSGICADGICVSQKHGVGEKCQAGMACESGACSGGVCLAQKLGNGETCPDGEDDDCQNGACGKSSYPFGYYVCCLSNALSWYDGYFCTETGEVGDDCVNSDTCKSGICYDNACVSQRLANGAPCPNEYTGDCQNDSCGMNSYPTGTYVCCSSNQVVIEETGVNFKRYCTATQNNGQMCSEGLPEVCKSGVCSKGVCAAY
jgi:hypothetical protein